MAVPIVILQERVIPFARIQSDITNYCNLRCKFCFNTWEAGKKTSFMTPQTLEKLVAILPLVRRSPFGFLFSCVYEPTVHPDMVSLLQRIPDDFRDITFMTTNLARKMDDAQLRSMLGSALNTVNISLETFVPEVYKAICSRDRHAVFMDNLTRLAQIYAATEAPKPQLRYTTMVLRSNMRELPRIAADCYRHLHAAGHEFRTPYSNGYLLKNRQWFSQELLSQDELEDVRRRCEEASPVASFIFSTNLDSFPDTLRDLEPLKDNDIFDDERHSDEKLRRGLLQCDADGNVTVYGKPSEIVNLNDIEFPYAYFLAKRGQQLLKAYSSPVEEITLAALQERLISKNIGPVNASLDTVALENGIALHIEGDCTIKGIQAELEYRIALFKGDDVRLYRAFSQPARTGRPVHLTVKHLNGNPVSGKEINTGFSCYIDARDLPPACYECRVLALLPNARGKGVLSSPLAAIDLESGRTV